MKYNLLIIETGAFPIEIPEGGVVVSMQPAPTQGIVGLNSWDGEVAHAKSSSDWNEVSFWQILVLIPVWKL